MRSQPKPQSRRDERVALRHAENAVIRKVRVRAVTRDGYCRVPDAVVGSHDGRSEMAHLESRAKTKGLRRFPEERHNTGIVVMACRCHHDHIDGKRRPKLCWDYLTDRGADGPMRWWVKSDGIVYVEDVTT